MDPPASGGLDPLGDVGQLPLFGPGFYGIGDIYNHAARAANPPSPHNAMVRFSVQAR